MPTVLPPHSHTPIGAWSLLTPYRQEISQLDQQKDRCGNDLLSPEREQKMKRRSRGCVSREKVNENYGVVLTVFTVAVSEGKP
jgi:hypothetical protein